MFKLRLEGKIALVTGASKGIGASIARAFAGEGAYVLVNYRSSDAEAKAVVDSIAAAGGKAESIKADVADPTDVATMFDFISTKFHRLDILMNCAGVADASIWNAKLSEITPAMWKKVMSVDVIGGFLCDQRAASLMTGGGAMINIASTPVLVGDTQGLVYRVCEGFGPHEDQDARKDPRAQHKGELHGARFHQRRGG